MIEEEGWKQETACGRDSDGYPEGRDEAYLM